MDASGSTMVLRRSSWLQPPTQSHSGRDLDPVQSSVSDKPVFAKPIESAGAAATEFLLDHFVCSRHDSLLEGDKPVRLGSRALEILVLLLERPAELVEIKI